MRVRAGGLFVITRIVYQDRKSERFKDTQPKMKESSYLLSVVQNVLEEKRSEGGTLVQRSP